MEKYRVSQNYVNTDGLWYHLFPAKCVCALSGIVTRDFGSIVAADLCLGLHCHWNRRQKLLVQAKYIRGLSAQITVLIYLKYGTGGTEKR